MTPPRRDAVVLAIRTAVAAIAKRRGLTAEVATINADPPAVCDATLVATIETAAARCGLSCQRMVSRAYHDALFMTRLCPTAMIFIPCREGISHRPDEYASPQAITQGVAVLAQTLAELSQTA